MTKREKTMLYIAALFLVIVAYIMVVLPYMSKTDTMAVDTAFLQDEIAMQDQKLEMIPRLTEQVEGDSNDLESLQQAYEKVQTQEEIATYFTKLAEDKGLFVTSFFQKSSNQLLQDRGLELCPLAEVTLTCTGDYQQYIAMVDTLNQRTDITVLSTTYEVKNAQDISEEYTVTCLLLMNVETDA